MVFAEDLNLKATLRGMLPKYTADTAWISKSRRNAAASP
jgi:hypothetical protein